MPKIISLPELIKQATEIYGEDKLDWEFKCPHCKRVQSGRSVLAQMERGEPSQRYGIIKKGHQWRIETSCYSPDCNWVANGLFRAPVLMIYDPHKPHDEDTLDNCTRIFPLAAW